MYCIRKITKDLFFVGGNDRRPGLFEGVYAVPDGVSYNSYLLVDDVTVLFDTVDASVSKLFFENIAHVLDGRPLDYVIVQHMEPDHSASLHELLLRYPDVKIICNKKTAEMMQQFFGRIDNDRFQLVTEDSAFKTARHDYRFRMAPMVHWPEVMVTYDTVDRILFSADAFGCFGAQNGALFADEVDFMRDYLDEARRYYTNIVGKYGTQVQALLRKAGALDIAMICPLHGFVFRKNIPDILGYYQKWSTYTPESNGVMIAYASVYGNTANIADILAAQLFEKGVKAAVYDVSVTPAPDIIAASFRYSHLVFLSTTYNAGIFVAMENLLRDLAAHNIANRTVALVENGSWAPTAGKLMRDILTPCKNMHFLSDVLTVRSALREDGLPAVYALADTIAASVSAAGETASPAPGAIDNTALFRLSYGLYLLSARDGDKDNGCIINTAQLLTDAPKKIAVTVNKKNYTHDMILKSGFFALSVLSVDADFETVRRFGFVSGRDTDKFTDAEKQSRTKDGTVFLTHGTNAVIGAHVTDTVDCGTHTLFIAELTEACALSDSDSATYAYYQEHMKPRPAPAEERKTGFVCKVCGYVYEGETLPPDFICPLCKHGAEEFEPLK